MLSGISKKIPLPPPQALTRELLIAVGKSFIWVFTLKIPAYFRFDAVFEQLGIYLISRINEQTYTVDEEVLKIAFEKGNARVSERITNSIVNPNYIIKDISQSAAEYIISKQYDRENTLEIINYIASIDAELEMYFSQKQNECVSWIAKVLLTSITMLAAIDPQISEYLSRKDDYSEEEIGEISNKFLLTNEIIKEEKNLQVEREKLREIQPAWLWSENLSEEEKNKKDGARYHGFLILDNLLEFKLLIPEDKRCEINAYRETLVEEELIKHNERLVDKYYQQPLIEWFEDLLIEFTSWNKNLGSITSEFHGIFYSYCLETFSDQQSDRLSLMLLTIDDITKEIQDHVTSAELELEKLAALVNKINTTNTNASEFYVELMRSLSKKIEELKRVKAEFFKLKDCVEWLARMQTTTKDQQAIKDFVDGKKSIDSLEALGDKIYMDQCASFFEKYAEQVAHQEKENQLLKEPVVSIESIEEAFASALDLDTYYSQIGDNLKLSQNKIGKILDIMGSLLRKMTGQASVNNFTHKLITCLLKDDIASFNKKWQALDGLIDKLNVLIKSNFIMAQQFEAILQEDERRTTAINALIQLKRKAIVFENAKQAETDLSIISSEAPNNAFRNAI